MTKLPKTFRCSLIDLLNGHKPETKRKGCVRSYSQQQQQQQQRITVGSQVIDRGEILHDKYVEQKDLCQKMSALQRLRVIFGTHSNNTPNSWNYFAKCLKSKMTQWLCMYVYSFPPTEKCLIYGYRYTAQFTE